MMDGMGGMGWGGRLALLLVLLNLVILGTGLALEHYRQTEHGLTGYNTDKIHLLRTPGDAGPSLESGLGGIGLEEPLTGVGAGVAGQVEAPAAADGTVAEPGACLVLEDFDQAAHERLGGELAGAGLRPGDYTLRLAKPLGWWVYIPPEANTVLRQETVARLKGLGINDLAVIGRGSMVNAISLGMFAEPAQAAAHLERLRAKGVAGAAYGPRPGVGPARLDLSALSAARRAALPADLRQRLRACP
jgi:hypothetical protein